MRVRIRLACATRTRPRRTITSTSSRLRFGSLSAASSDGGGVSVAEGAGGQFVPAAEIKVEAPLTEKEQMNKRVETFIAWPSAVYKTLNVYHLEAKDMIVLASNHPYGASFAEGLKTHVASLSKAMVACDKITLGHDYNKATLPAMLLDVDRMEAAHQKHLEYARANGIAPKTSAAEKKKRKVKAE